MPRYLSPAIVQFMTSRLGCDRTLWGTNGLPWKKSLDQFAELGIKEDVQKKILYQNAIELFSINEAGAGLKPALDPAGIPYKKEQ
jgi:predicted TIM-barrel fold metal-dependent hydrolase